MEYMFITNDIKIAEILDKNDVITWIDLEKLGKEERQSGMNTIKSDHSIRDIRPIKEILKNTPLLVRINPIHENSKEEIDQVVKEGADIIMLPMFKNKYEVKKFIDYVNGRCQTMLLFETKESVENIESILTLPGIDKVHIGLNDLHLSYGIDFMFSLVTNGTVEYICEKFKKYSLSFGFGGVAKLGFGDIPGEYILIEHQRLGSSSVILSRSFCDAKKYDNLILFEEDFKRELTKLCKFEEGIAECSDAFIINNHNEMVTLVKALGK